MAAKLSALHGIGDGKVTDLSMAMRSTSFKLSESEAGVITDRVRRYSSKLGGSRKDRQKFLRRNSKSKKVATVSKDDHTELADTKDVKVPLIGNTSLSDNKASELGKKGHAIGSIVEEAVNATM